MSLEGLIGKEEVKKLTGKPFNIDPRGSYDRDEFVKKSKNLFKLEQYYSKLKENANDIGALQDLIKYTAPFTPGDTNENMILFQENPHLALEQAENLFSSGTVAMGQFVEDKRRSLLEKLNGKQLYEIFKKVPLYDTGNREYDKIRDLRDKVMQLEQAEEKKIDPMAVLGNELQELYAQISPEQRRFISENQHLILPSLLKAIGDKIQKANKKSFKNEDGSFNEPLLRDYLVANYKAVEDQMASAPASVDKGSFWNDNLKPHYIEIARALYKSEKSKQEEEEDSEKKVWQKKSEDKGMRT